MNAVGRGAVWRTARAVLPAFVVARLVTAAAVLTAIEAQSGIVSWPLVRAAFLHWDAASYVAIAAHGYPASLDYHDAFLPGYPLLIRAAGALGGDLVVAGVVVSAVAELVALVAVHALARSERDAGVARFAVWAVALAPTALFLAGVYSESPFIAAAAVSLVLMRRGDTRGASIAGAAAVSMRLTGIALLPVIAVHAYVAGGPRSRIGWVAVVPLPLVLFAAYLQLRTGDALAFLHAEALPSFGEASAWPWDGLRTTWETAATSSDPTNRAIFEREVAAGVAGLVAVVAGWLDRGFPRSFALYCTLVWLMAVSLTFWRSVPRYDLALFPLVLVVADVSRRLTATRVALLAATGAVLAWASFVYAQGGWIG